MKRGTRRNRMFLAVFLSLCLAVTMLGGSVTVRAEEETQGTSLTDPAEDSVTEQQEEEQTDESKEGQPSTQEEEDQSTVQEGESRPTAQEEEDPPVKQQEGATDPESESGTDVSGNSAPAEEEDVSGNDIDLMMNSTSTRAIARGPQGMLVIKIGNTVQGAADPDETFSFHVEMNIAKYDRFFYNHPVVYYYAGSDYPSLSDLQPSENLDFSETFALKDGENYYLAACLTDGNDNVVTQATVTMEETDSKGYNVSYQKYGGGKQDGSGDWGEPVGSETEGAVASHNWGTSIWNQSICYGVGFINTMPGNQYSLMYDTLYPVEEELTEMPQDESVTSQEDSYTFTIPSQEPYQGYWYKNGGNDGRPLHSYGQDYAYKFIGWVKFNSAGQEEVRYSPGDTVTVTKDEPTVKLYALWEQQIIYYLIYTKNGPGEYLTGGFPDYQGYATSEGKHTFIISSIEPKQNKQYWNSEQDYVFAGWSDERTTGKAPNYFEGGVRYHPGDSITLKWDEPKKFLYAVMKEAGSYSLIYDANNPEEEVTEMPQDENVTSQEDSYTFTIPSQEPYQGEWYKYGGLEGYPAWFSTPDFLYEFKGWATSPDGQAEYQPGDTVTVTKENPELRLYAVWEKQYYYRLSSVASGPGELINNRWSLTYITTEKEHTFVIPDQLPEMSEYWGPNGWYYTDNEYICIGYSDTDTFVYPSDTSDRSKCFYHFNFYPGTVDYRPGDSITLTADDPSKGIYVVMEESRGYTLTYDANAPAGEVSGLPDPQSAKGGQTEHVFRVSEKIPVRAGWKFEGWALEAAGTVCCQAGGRVTARGDAPDMILYAVWSKEQGNPSGGQNPNPGGSNPGNPNPGGSNPTPGTSAPGTPANDSLLAQIAAAAQGVLGVRTDETAQAGQEAASGQAQGVLGARTGDEAPIAAWAMTFALSALALAVLRRKRGAKTA